MATDVLTHPGKLRHRLSPEEKTTSRIIEGAVKYSSFPTISQLSILRSVAAAIYEKQVVKAEKENSLPEDVMAAYEVVALNSLRAEEDLHDLEGGSLSSAEIAQRLNLSAETIRNYQKQGKLFAWKKDRKNFRFPAWQIVNKKVLPGLDSVLHYAQEKEWTPNKIISFFLSPSDVLNGKSPLDALREGDVQSVLRVAQQEGEIGA